MTPSPSPQWNPYQAPQAATGGPIDVESRSAAGLVAEGPLEVADYRRARQLATRAPAWIKFSLSAVVLLVAIPYFYHASPPPVSTGLRFVMAVVVSLVLLGVLWGCRYLARFVGGQSACHQLNRVQRREFSDDGVTAASVDGCMQSSWSRYRGYRHAGHLLVLFHDHVSPLILFEPVAAYQFADPDDWRRLLQLLRGKFPNQR